MMNPIVCKVVSSSFIGVFGLRVQIDCKDLGGNNLASYVGRTDTLGIVYMWNPEPVGLPRLVDPTVFPRVSVKFFCGPDTPPYPWSEIQADLHVNDHKFHGIILYIDEKSGSYYLKYTNDSTLILGPAPTETIEMAEATTSRSPSPLMLPDPLQDGEILGDAASAAPKWPTTDSRKRKRTAGLTSMDG